MCRMRCALCFGTWGLGRLSAATSQPSWPLLHHHDLAPGTCHGWTQDTQTSQAHSELAQWQTSYHPQHVQDEQSCS
jgi:hypothetical protein